MILIKTDEEIEGIRKAAQVVAEVLEYSREIVKPGVMTKEVDAKIKEFIENRGGYPAFLGYRGYPAASCISLNDEVVHGIPGNRKIKEGDLVKVDVGVNLNGYIGDAAITIIVGDVSPKVRKLVETTERALYNGINQAYPGSRLSDISHAIQVTAEKEGFSVVRDLGGHGVGLKLHEEPFIPNYGPPGRGPVLKMGMTLALEPMVNMGHPHVKTKKDGWTVVTRDGSLSAHFEHTIAILDNGPEILSKIS